MSTTRTTFTSDDKEIQKTLAKMNAEMVKLREQSKKAAQESKKGSRESKRGLDVATKAASAFAGSIGLALGPLAAVSAAVKLLKLEYVDLKERQDSAARAGITAAAATKQAILNSPSQSAAQVEAAIAKVSADTDVPSRDVALAISSASSAKGELPFDRAVETVKQTLRLVPESPEAQESLSGSALDTQKVFPKVSAKDALGFAIALGGQARVTSTEKISKNVIPPTLAVAREGSSPQDSGALVAAFTQSIFDVEGRLAGTAAIKFDAAIREQFPKIHERSGVGGGIRHLRENPEARAEFLDKISVETKARGAVKGIITPDSDVARSFDSASQNLPKLKGESGRIFDKRVLELKNAQSQLVVQVDRGFKATAERLRIADVKGGLAGASRAGLENVLSATGAGVTSRTIALAAFDANSGIGTNLPVQAALDQLKAQQFKASIQSQFAAGPTPFGRVSKRQKDEQTQAGIQAKKLDRVIDALERLLKVEERSNRNLDNIDRGQNQNRRAEAAAAAARNHGE